MKIIMGTKYFSIQDLAEQFGKSDPTIYRWMNAGKLKGTRCGNETLFTADDVNRFIAESREGGDDAAPCAN